MKALLLSALSAYETSIPALRDLRPRYSGSSSYTSYRPSSSYSSYSYSNRHNYNQGNYTSSTDSGYYNSYSGSNPVRYRYYEIPDYGRDWASIFFMWVWISLLIAAPLRCCYVYKYVNPADFGGNFLLAYFCCCCGTSKDVEDSSSD